jgi:hypothetical protein
MVLMKKTYEFARRGPDCVTEELAAALSKRISYDFKSLFDVIYASLRARKAAGGGEEMLRLRAYEKLQGLVQDGMVKKAAKKYKGCRPDIVELGVRMKELRLENNQRNLGGAVV